MHCNALSLVTILPHTPSPCFNVDVGVPSFAPFAHANRVMFPAPLAEFNLYQNNCTGASGGVDVVDDDTHAAGGVVPSE